MTQQTTQDSSTSVTLDEIIEVLENLPANTKPNKENVNDNGDTASALRWLSRVQGYAAPKLNYPRIALFAATHENAAEHGHKDALKKSIAAHQNATSETYRLSEACDAELQIYEMDLDNASRDFTRGPAMTRSECAYAITYGMMVAQPGVHLLCLGALNSDDLTGKAVCHALYGEKLLYPPTPEIENALKHHGTDHSSPLDILTKFGNYDIAAILGTLIAAHLGQIPVVLEGTNALAAAGILKSTRPDLNLEYRCTVTNETKDIAQVIGIEALDETAPAEPGCASAAAIAELQKLCAV